MVFSNVFFVAGVGSCSSPAAVKCKNIGIDLYSDASCTRKNTHPSARLLKHTHIHTHSDCNKMFCINYIDVDHHSCEYLTAGNGQKSTDKRFVYKCTFECVRPCYILGTPKCAHVLHFRLINWSKCTWLYGFMAVQMYMLCRPMSDAHHGRRHKTHTHTRRIYANCQIYLC